MLRQDRGNHFGRVEERKAVRRKAVEIAFHRLLNFDTDRDTITPFCEGH